jgi:vesicle-associated membrane protein 7
MPGILYSLVTRGSQVLAEFTEQGLQGNFASITRVLLKKIPPEDGKLSYVYDQYVFHYTVSGGLTYLCMCEKELARLVAFRFLSRVESEFLRLYANRWSTATAYQFNADFKGILDHLMREYSAIKDEKIAKINEQLSDIKDVMTRNIDKVLERGEKIEILVDKSMQMEQSAFRFHSKAVKLRRKFCCTNVKWWIFGIVVLVVSA